MDLLDLFIERHVDTYDKEAFKQRLIELTEAAFDAGRELSFEGRDVKLETALDMAEIEIKYSNFEDFIKEARGL